MTDRLRLAPQDLRTRAGAHRDVAAELDRAGADDRPVLASLDSLGPVFSQLREAAVALLHERRETYRRQAEIHAELARRLDDAAAIWDEHDGDAADRLGSVGP